MIDAAVLRDLAAEEDLLLLLAEGERPSTTGIKPLVKASIRPATVSFEPGVVVPMPMLPFDSMTIESPIVSGLVHFRELPGSAATLNSFIGRRSRAHVRRLRLRASEASRSHSQALA